MVKNFRDNDTGETLVPVYKFQDALGIWHQKALEECSRMELYSFSIALWNKAMEVEAQKQKYRHRYYSTVFLVVLIVILLVFGGIYVY